MTDSNLTEPPVMTQEGIEAVVKEVINERGDVHSKAVGWDILQAFHRAFVGEKS